MLLQKLLGFTSKVELSTGKPSEITIRTLRCSVRVTRRLCAQIKACHLCFLLTTLLASSNQDFCASETRNRPLICKLYVISLLPGFYSLLAFIQSSLLCPPLQARVNPRISTLTEQRSQSSPQDISTHCSNRDRASSHRARAVY